MCYCVVGVELHCCLLYQTVMTLRTVLYWFITQGVVVNSYRRFGTTYRLGQITCLVPLFTLRRTAFIELLRP